MANLTWEYIAGFFDGEGCVSCYNNPARPDALTVVASIAQTGLEGHALLTEIKDFLTGHGIKSYLDTKHSRMRSHPTYRKSYALRICAKPSLIPFLTNMIPYLRIKKVVAQDTLRFYTMYPTLRGVRVRNENAAMNAARTRLPDLMLALCLAAGWTHVRIAKEFGYLKPGSITNRIARFRRQNCR